MTRNEFIELLEEKLEPNAQMEFLIWEDEIPIVTFLDIRNVCMRSDDDGLNDKKFGSVAFTIRSRYSTI